MLLSFGYGQSNQTVEIAEKNLLAILKANPLKHEHYGLQALEFALKNPIGTPKLQEMAQKANLQQKGKKIVIITSDITRPLPTWQILPAVLNELYEAQVPKENITIVFGLGSHRPHTQTEMCKLVGEEIFKTIHCVDSDPTDCLYLGTTKANTPVAITRLVAEADFRIALANIEYHYFAGYSGGAKSLMPGVSTPEAIQNNHKMMTHSNARAGQLTDNPVREDLEEAENLCKLDFIINVILNEQKEIVYAVAGDVKKAHRIGCAYLDKMYRTPIDQKADIVIVSQGGAPKDANLYQTQKALDNAKHAIKEGGTIILIGACNEGFGNKCFEEWLLNSPSPQAIIDRLRHNFQLGGHKAAAIAMVLQHCKIILVSNLSQEIVKKCFLLPKLTAQEALTEALKEYGPDASIIAMPYGGSTLPYLQNNN